MASSGGESCHQRQKYGVPTQEGEGMCKDQELFLEQLFGPASTRPADCGNPITPPPWHDKAKIRSAFKSIQLVRRMHTSAFTDAHKANIAIASQADMVVTQWAFFGLVITHGEQLGIRCTRKEEESLIHFWKCIGYLLGIEDRYNLGSGEVEEVRGKCEAVMKAVITVGLTSPPEQFPEMADTVLQGVHMIVPAVDPAAFLAFIHHLLAVDHDQNLSWYSTFMLYNMIWSLGHALHYPVLGEVLRIIQNGLLSFALFVCNSLPFVAWFYRWLEVNILNIVMYLGSLYKRALHGLLILFRIKQS
ncbi:uncharacterized protein [Procambarus clarkii]|uniref:uncharacterized protein isoform X3 n=1 Tax=Procambarus clarkii TaxID=6728 RepID=UPI0037440B7A